MRHKRNNKGTALVEYAILLSFVSVIGFSFVGDKGFAGNINSIINSTTKVLGQALGLQSFDEAALKKDLIGLKDSGYITYEHNYNQSLKTSLGSLLKDDTNYDEGKFDKAIENSIKFEEKYLADIDFGEVPLESWRFFNDGGSLEVDSAYLIWSDTDWSKGTFLDDSSVKTPLMYAKINRIDNTVTYGVGYGNPVELSPDDGRINGYGANRGGMVNVNEGFTGQANLYIPWGDTGVAEYRSSESSLFTPDYNKAVSLYKELKAATQK